MESLKLAWRNLFRHRMRTCITVLGVSLSLALVQTYHNFTAGVYAYMVDCGVKAGSGHIAVYRPQYLADRNPDLAFAPAPEDEDIARIPGVRAVLPRFYLPALAQSSRENRNIQLVGADVPREAGLNPYLRKLPREVLERPMRKRDAFVGAGLARELGLQQGSRFVITVQNGHGELVSELFHLRGIIESGIRDVDTSLVMAMREQVSAMAGAGNATHELAIILDNADMAASVFPAVRQRLLSSPEGLEAVSWEQAMPNLYNAIRWDYVSVKFLSFIVLAIVTIGVVNTLLMSVMERMREFGLTLALGASPGRVRLLVMTEGLLMGVVSMLAGSCIGSLATAYLVHAGFDLRPFIPENLEFGGVLFSALLYAKWDIPWMMEVAAYILLLCLGASLYPGIRASRAMPVETLRHI